MGPIAVDFGCDSLKLLQLSSDAPTRVIAAAAAVVPGTARRDMGARQAFVAQTLPRLLASQPFQGRRVICSLPAFQSIVQHMEVPAVEDEDGLELQVQLQLRERMDVDPDRMVVRYFPIAQVTREGQPMQDVLCLAAGRDVVMRHIELLSRMKLNVVGMHSEAMAIQAAFANAAPTPEQATCFIDIGATTTKVVILQNGEIAFAKTIQVAGDELTQQYATREHMDFEQARLRRIEQAGAEVSQPVGAAGPRAAVGTGLPSLDAQAGVTSVAGATGVAAEAVADAAAVAEGDAIETLIDELQMGLRYHRRLFPGCPVGKLVFLGGEAHQSSLCQQIARNLQVAAQRGDPLASVHERAGVKPTAGVDLGEPQPGWAVPYGLAISQPNL
ncbi:MAG: pilus assembly protein PilM [Phycisphaeraceae bacterium]